VRPFTYVRPTDEASALSFAVQPGARFVAGGTNLVDNMRLDVERPRVLVDIGSLPLTGIEDRADGLTVGALVRNSDLAEHPLVTSRFPALAQALLAGASPQLRNAATVGGNLLQRTRCPYFRDPASACNKRVPGSGCAAMDGFNRSHAVLGTSSSCIAAHPSDMDVALVALDATVHIRGPQGARAIPAADLHVVPGDRPDVETVMRAGELITHVVLPDTPFAAHSTYLKVRDRASFAFALASAAVALDVQGGVIRSARIALGGVGTKPWRSHEAEGALVGKAPSRALFATAARAALQDARPRKYNAFKVELAQRTIVRALSTVGGVT
jgi:xanthine dehydrogenase YagS FAD-binding subunit